jgi:hypothetical protein
VAAQLRAIERYREAGQVRIRNLANGYWIVRELEEIAEAFVEAQGEIGHVDGEGGCL